MTHCHALTSPGWDWSALRAICLREAQRVLGASASAEDAAQEAMVRAWRRQTTCHTPDKPHAWITTIARREALRHVRRPREACLDDLPARSHPRSEPEDGLLQGATVRQAIAGLDYEDRWLVHARYWRDLSDAEMAGTLGLAEPTVRVRLHRLRSGLKEALTET